MSKKLFSADMILQLRQNPYTYRVTEDQISFTREFKEEFWRLYMTRALNANQIMRVLGYDPEMLGQSRITGIQRQIKVQALSGEGFHAGRRTRQKNVEKMKGMDLKQISEQEMLKVLDLEKLQTEYLHMEQEVDYLRRIAEIRRRPRQER